MPHAPRLTALLGAAALSAGASAQPVPTAESTLLLTWFDDPTTTMAVQWITDGDVPPRTAGSATHADHPAPALTDELTFDGRPDDWGKHGARFDYLPQPDGGWPEPDTGSATLKVGHTPHGLAVLVTVADDEVTPAGLEGWNRTGDRVELRLSTDDGSHPLRLAVGAPAEDGADRIAVLSQSDGAEPVAPTAAFRATDTGWTAEALLPWTALPGFEAAEGARVRLQVEVHDTDGPFAPLSLSLAGHTYPHQSWRRAVTLRLAPAGRVDAARARVEARRDAETGRRVLALGGEPRLIGETVTVRSGEVTVAKVKLEDVLGFAGAELTLDAPWDGPDAAERLDAVTLELDGRTLARHTFDAGYWAAAPAPGAVAAADVEDAPAPPVIPAVSVHPFGPHGWFVHRLELLGLEPGTDYAVAVPGRLAPVRFRTAPAELTEPLVFAEGGDVGTSHHVGMLHDEAAAWDPLFGLVGGDCAYGNGIDPEDWHAYLKLWNEHLTPAGGRSVPMLAAIGNHEVAGGWGKTPAASPFFRALFGPAFSPRGAYGVIDFGGDADDADDEDAGATPYASIYLLDSGHTHEHGGRQARWLASALGARTDVPHQFACYHVPAYPSHRLFNGPHSAAARAAWTPVFDQHDGLDLVFEHHDHTYKRTHPLRGGEPTEGGVVYLGDGCWGRTPRSAHPERPYLAVAKSERNVMRVTLHPDGTQDVRAVNEHGEVLDEITAGRPAATVSAE